VRERYDSTTGNPQSQADHVKPGILLQQPGVLTTKRQRREGREIPRGGGPKQSSGYEGKRPPKKKGTHLKTEKIQHYLLKRKKNFRCLQQYPYPLTESLGKTIGLQGAGGLGPSENRPAVDNPYLHPRQKAAEKETRGLPGSSGEN